MPIGHSSFESLRRRRLRPSWAAWGLSIAGVGALGSSAMAFSPLDVALLAVLLLATGATAWHWGRRTGLAVGVVSGLLYLALEMWQGRLDTVEALRGAPAMVGLLALAVALAEVGYLSRGLAQSSMLDQVTRLPNYDLFTRFLHIEVSRSARYRLPFCLVVLELEDLEGYSHTYGYWRTDALLKELSRTMSETLRRSDVLGRLGGPQFGLLLPMTKSDGAMVALQRLQSAVSVLPLPTTRGVKPRPIAWTAGIAEFPGDGQDATDLLRVAGERIGIKTVERLALPGRY